MQTKYQNVTRCCRLSIIFKRVKAKIFALFSSLGSTVRDFLQSKATYHPKVQRIPQRASFYQSADRFNIHLFRHEQLWSSFNLACRIGADSFHCNLLSPTWESTQEVLTSIRAYFWILLVHTCHDSQIAKGKSVPLSSNQMLLTGQWHVKGMSSIFHMMKEQSFENWK